MYVCTRMFIHIVYSYRQIPVFIPSAICRNDAFLILAFALLWQNNQKGKFWFCSLNFFLFFFSFQAETKRKNRIKQVSQENMHVPNRSRYSCTENITSCGIRSGWMGHGIVPFDLGHCGKNGFFVPPVESGSGMDRIWEHGHIDILTQMASLITVWEIERLSMDSFLFLSLHPSLSLSLSDWFELLSDTCLSMDYMYTLYCSYQSGTDVVGVFRTDKAINIWICLGKSLWKLCSRINYRR